MDLKRKNYQRNSSWNTPYTFSGKEKDVETGYGYFGARYYDSGLSIWLSVDSMSDKYPNLSPYNYCANNPVIFIDPDGRELIILGSAEYIAAVEGVISKLRETKAGNKLVNMVIKSKLKLVIASTPENRDNEISPKMGNNYRVLYFNPEQTIKADGVTLDPVTTLAHEMGHFVTDYNHPKLVNGISAEEFGAVEWENRVRKDLNRELRKTYDGVNVFGKECSSDGVVKNKKNYMNDINYNLIDFNIETRPPKDVYYFKGRIVNPGYKGREKRFSYEQ
ncbi:MAG: RHS repeat-associated core domain-containing protein [Bacteroidales bacterium]|jgi:RHS repeat-associated protein|nr:RHS repeat-associated core domain-containing protein [Bacteroidales bacterium]